MRTYVVMRIKGSAAAPLRCQAVRLFSQIFKRFYCNNMFCFCYSLMYYICWYVWCVNVKQSSTPYMQRRIHTNIWSGHSCSNRQQRRYGETHIYIYNICTFTYRNIHIILKEFWKVYTYTHTSFVKVNAKSGGLLREIMLLYKHKFVPMWLCAFFSLW